MYKDFVIPNSFLGLLNALLKPLKYLAFILKLLYLPNTKLVYPFLSRETLAPKRFNYLISSSSVSNFYTARKGLLYKKFSTKLLVYLALDSIIVLRIHASLTSFEDSINTKYESTIGFSKGKNDSIKYIYFELPCRD